MVHGSWFMVRGLKFTVEDRETEVEERPDLHAFQAKVRVGLDAPGEKRLPFRVSSESSGFKF
jgi:hypothetical protein